MKPAMNYGCLLGVMVLLPALCHSQSSFTPTRATYYGSPDSYGTSTGACGYGEDGTTMSNGYVTGVSSLYGNGSGCGACYQVRCTKPQCTGKGVYVVVTDHGEGDRTDFILSARAYARMAWPGQSKQLLAYGVVEVEFRRVPCRYGDNNIMYKVQEDSKKPGYLAIVMLYVGGAYDITAVEYWQDNRHGWKPMRNVYGAVYDTQSPPSGEVNLRFQVSWSNRAAWVHPIFAIPGDWEAGAYYDSGFQLS